MLEAADCIGIRPRTRQSQGGLDSGNAHGQGCYTAKKSLLFQVFPMIGIWPICGRCDGNQKTTQGILENGMPTGAGISFSKMPYGCLQMPSRFLCLVSFPPNTLQILLEVFTLSVQDGKVPSWIAEGTDHLGVRIPCAVSQAVRRHLAWAKLPNKVDIQRFNAAQCT